MEQGKDKGWNPYIAGALTGLLLIFSVWFTGKYVGASTTFVRSAGYIERIFDAERVAQDGVFQKRGPEDRLAVSLCGGHLLRRPGSVNHIPESFRWQAVPDLWKRRFGPSVPKRAIVAFIGGAIAMFGARLADG